MRQVPGGDFEIAMQPVDIEDLRSLVMDLRLFIAKGNPTHIDRVFNAAHRHVTDERLVDALKDVRKQWRLRWEKEGVARMLQEGGASYTAPEILDLWINGRWFHPDDAKARELDALDNVNMTGWMLMAAAETAAKGVLLAGGVVRKALRDGLVSSTPVR